MSAAAAAADSTQADSAHPGELDGDRAAKRFSLSGYQLNKLPGRRLSRSESQSFGYGYRAVKLYKISDLQALGEQVEKRRTGKQSAAAKLPEPAVQTWDFDDTGAGNTDEIDELKVAEHYKLSAASLRPLPCRKLRAEIQDSSGLSRWRSIKVYKLDEVFQLVTDLQTRVDEEHDTEPERHEAQQEARRAEAFEAACQAKALVKTWKKPRLSPGQTCLPSELWGLVLEQLLSEDSLWDLQGTVQGLCHISLTSKGLYAAVQQQGWRKLSCMLQPLRPPAAVQGNVYRSIAGLPASLDVLVTNPASLSVPQLRAACTYYWQTSSGTKAELMIRVLARFGLSHPCSAPPLVVVHSHVQAMQLLLGIQNVCIRARQGRGNRGLSPAHFSACQQLYTQHIETAPTTMLAAMDYYRPVPADIKPVVEARAKLVGPGLLAAFGSLKVFLDRCYWPGF